MELGIASYGLGFLAGVVSTLSPCVLPLLPILIASAAAAHPLGSLALAGGLMVSFTSVGLFLAALGASLGLDPMVLRTGAAILLAIFGLILLSRTLQQRFASAAAGLSQTGNQALSRIRLDGARGQFVLGLLLGAVWSPCVGPTLGAAITLASQGQNLGQVGLVMLLFAVGASLPVVLLGLLSRSAMQRARNRLSSAGKYGKVGLGIVLLAVGVLILTGLDKRIEAWTLANSPDWLTNFAIGI